MNFRCVECKKDFRKRFISGLFVNPSKCENDKCKLLFITPRQKPLLPAPKAQRGNDYVSKDKNSGARRHRNGPGKNPEEHRVRAKRNPRRNCNFGGYSADFRDFKNGVLWGLQNKRKLKKSPGALHELPGSEQPREFKSKPWFLTPGPEEKFSRGLVQCAGRGGIRRVWFEGDRAALVEAKYIPYSDKVDLSDDIRQWAGKWLLVRVRWKPGWFWRFWAGRCWRTKALKIRTCRWARGTSRLSVTIATFCWSATRGWESRRCWNLSHRWVIARFMCVVRPRRMRGLLWRCRRIIRRGREDWRLARWSWGNFRVLT